LGLLYGAIQRFGAGVDSEQRTKILNQSPAVIVEGKQAVARRKKSYKPREFGNAGIAVETPGNFRVAEREAVVFLVTIYI